MWQTIYDNHEKKNVVKVATKKNNITWNVGSNIRDMIWAQNTKLRNAFSSWEVRYWNIVTKMFLKLPMVFLINLN